MDNKTITTALKKIPKWFQSAYFIALMLCGSSCTYNISMVHTEGNASDVIDDNDTPTVNASASLTK